MRLRPKPLALIALCVIAALALTACGGRSHTVAPGAVAEVSKQPISKSDFDHWASVVVSTQAAPGSKTKPKMPKPGSSQYQQLTRQVIQFLVSARWINGEAAERGITGTPAEVKRQFAQTKSQSFPTNKAYNDFLKRSGQSESDIMYRVRLDLLANKLRQNITKDVSTVSDSSIASYYKQNEQQFSQPERRDLEMVKTKTPGEAAQALSQLQKGEKFAKVAKTLSIDPATKQQGGKLLGVVKGQQEKTLDGAIFGAVKGQLAGPIKTQGGYVVLRVDKVTPATKQTLAQSKEGIRQLLASQQQQKALDAFTTGFQKKWRSRTDCAKPYLTPECSNGPEPQTQTAGQIPGATGPQPPAKTGTGVAPANGSSQAPSATPSGVPGSPAAAAPTGAPAAQGTGVAPALGGGSAVGAQGVPQGAVPQGAQQQQQAPPQQQQQQQTPQSQGGAPSGGR